MRCRHCNVALAQSRGLIDGEFCCDAHRAAYEQARELDAPVETSMMAPVSAAIEKLRRKFAPRTAPASDLELAYVPEIPEAAYEMSDIALEARETAPGDTSEQFEPQELEPEGVESGELRYEDSVPESTGPVESHPNPGQQTAASGRWLSAAWKGAPWDLKLIGLALPVLVAVAVSGSIPKAPIRQLSPQSFGQMPEQFQKVVQTQWQGLNESISNRAAVAFSDDFRAGLDAWESRSNLTRTWSYDAAGFVRPGPLAVFKPTLDLSDYRFEFLGEIDQRAMGWAFRARDLKNYYAMKLVVVKPGPLPLVHLVRYAVINGKEGPHVDRPLPMTVRADSLYRIEVNARGDDFTILAQGQVVDFWSDHRLPRGGVGFFCNRGERARLSWVEVSHQYDALGRLCAYLAPYGIEGRNGIN
jgi:hypothetical protein